MKSLLTKLGVTMAVLVMTVLGIANFAGCAKNAVIDDISANLYSVDYKILASGDVNVTVNGPANDLSIVLTSPSGKTTIKTIKKENMATSCWRINIPIGDPEDGRWNLLVKKSDSDMAIWKKSISLSTQGVKVLDSYIYLAPEFGMPTFSCYRIVGCCVVFQKKSKSPFVFVPIRSTIKFNKEEDRLEYAELRVSEKENKFMLIMPGPYAMTSRQLRPANVLKVSARIFYKDGETDKFFEFKGSFKTPPEARGQQAVQLSQL
ncbi:MAG: hypothetical protein WCK10_02110 [Candidatus Staskawiczbacteria bacterium]